MGYVKMEDGKGSQGSSSERIVLIEMDEKRRPVWAEVDLDIVRENVRQISNKVHGNKITAVVKADAYGHGADRVAKAIEDQVDNFAVSVVEEAITLRENGINKPIMVLSYTPQSYFKEALENDFILNVLSYDYAEKLNQMAKSLGKKALVFVALDTGMERIGFSPEASGIAEIIKMKDLDSLSFESIYTHFAKADEKEKSFTNKQLALYEAAMNALKKNGMDFKSYHTANSAAIIDHEEAYFDRVRPGIILYGYYPSNEVDKDALRVKPAMTLKGQIIQLKTVKKGIGISYGHTFHTTREETLVATIPIGYADGYARRLSNKAQVIVGDTLCPQIGTICMDHIMVDVTKAKGVQVFDEVILMGEKGNLSFTADDMARLLDTINYEVICDLSPRVPRVYLDSKEK